MNTNLIWGDLETGGLNSRIENEKLGMEYYPILEIAIIITDESLEEVTPPLRIAVYQPESELAKCHEWALRRHTESGLLDDVRSSSVTLQQAENIILDYFKELDIQPYSAAEKTGAYFCGNSINFDRSFLMAQMPKLHAYLHYRQLDVSALNLSMKMFAPECAKKGTKLKQYNHEALADIRESIAEFRVYREFLINTNTPLEEVS